MATTKNIKDVMREEYMKCAKDPIYFMRKYVKIQHPQRGTIAFLTYQFQDKTLGELAKFKRNIILKSRQMGITTLVAAYALWLMTFHSDKEILCLSITQETSKAIVTKVRFANDNLPSWLRVKAATDNQLSLRLVNGSQIRAVSSAGSSGRSSALSLLIVDEAAFIDGIEEIWLSAQPALSTGGNVIILSTPNGVGNFFHRMWIKEDEQGDDVLNRISLPWHLHPDRDQKWRDEQAKLSGEKGSAQECDCEFSTSGNTVIDIPILQWYEKTYCTEPLEKRGFDKGYWIWKYPEPGKSYMVCADVARGDGRDFSGCHVLDIESLEQVAEYKGKLPTKEYGRMLMAVGFEYNTALLVPENATVGWAVIQEILDGDYPNLFYSGPDIQYVDAESQTTNKINSDEKKMTPGFTTSNKTRPLIISKLESYFRNKEVIVYSKRLIDELNVFIWKSAGVSLKAEAMTGYNDDLVMSLGIGLWIRDVALRLRKDSDTAVKSIISRIGSTSKEQAGKNLTSFIKSGAANPWGVHHNPWQMHVGGPGSQSKPQDLTWLLR
jgi:hypothetical protein